MFRDVSECSGVFHVPAFIDDRFIFHICSGLFGNTLKTYFRLLQLVQVQEGNHYGGHGGGYSKSRSKTNSFLLSSLTDLAKSVLLIYLFDSHLNNACGQILTHSPSMKIVAINIHDILSLHVTSTFS